MMNTSPNTRILVAGTGSIGRRHIRNLWNLGFRNFGVCDTDAERLTPVIDEFSVQPFTDYGHALDEFEPEVVLICTPPVFHLRQALLALEHKAHVFIEKPLSNTLDGTDALLDAAEKSARVVQVGYNLRFHPGLTKIKQLLDDGVVQRPLWARIEVGQYLPEWRPWQDYRQSYTARRELGGGIILDASHEIDYVLWLLGEPQTLICMAGQVSALDVNVEDCATILLRLKSNAQVDIHLDFVQRTYSRSCKLVTESETVEWSMAENAVHIRKPGSTETFSYEFEPNQMYIDEMDHFFQSIRSGNAASQSLLDSLQTLRVALAAHRSSAEERQISL